MTAPKKSLARDTIVSRLLERKNALITWQALADELGIKKGTLWRYCNDPEYTPKAAAIRRKLGLVTRERWRLECRDELEMIDLRKIRDLRRNK